MPRATLVPNCCKRRAICRPAEVLLNLVANYPDTMKRLAKRKAGEMVTA
jgi:hypothetical protein